MTRHKAQLASAASGKLGQQIDATPAVLPLPELLVDHEQIRVDHAEPPPDELYFELPLVTYGPGERLLSA